MASSRSETPSKSKEQEIIFSKKKNDFVVVGTDIYAKSDIVQVTTFDEAEMKLKRWIETQFSKIKGERSWITKWGDKTASKLINIGKVIGKNFFVIERDFLVNGKPLASYRVDWDDVKGIHYNPVVRWDHKHEDAYFLKIHFQPINVQSSSLQVSDQLRVHSYFLLLTKDVLKKNEAMPDEIANDLLINYKKISDRSYFQSFGVLLRPVVNVAITAFERHLSSQTQSSDKQIFDVSKINKEEIVIQVTNDLYEVWSLPIYTCIANLRAEVELTKETSLQPEIARIFLSECKYAMSSKNFRSDFVGSNISNVINSDDKEILPAFCNHLGDVLYLDANEREGLTKALTQQVLGSAKSSTSTVFQKLTITAPSPENKSSNDEFKANEKRIEDAAALVASSVTTHSSRRAFGDVTNQAKSETAHSELARRF